MKKTTIEIRLLFGIMMILLFASCQSTPLGYVDSFERFVERVEKNASSYSKEQWERNDKQFKRFIERYKTEKQKLSPEENEKIGRLMARYTKAKIGSGKLFDIIKETRAWFDCFNGFKKEITDYKSIIRGFVDGIEDGIEEYPVLKYLYDEFKKYLENN